MKILASLVSLAVVAFLPHVSFANKLAPARQAVKAAKDAAQGVRTGGQIGSGAAKAGNLGAAAGAAGGVAAGAAAGSDMKAGSSCNMGQYLTKRQTAQLAAMGKANGGLGQACAQDLFKSADVAGAASKAAEAYNLNTATIKAGNFKPYLKDLKRLLPEQSEKAGGPEALARGLQQGCNLAPQGV